ncbi:phage related lysozyme [Roseibium sp. TrichSKD4]|uniref:lysozyme n=1 Tax=Roseibium sp. TrichSKD4 TaxID=744980 RepID=UPI0001E5666D|nr:lysozyme [Roseibium sp. TrichSKD4]EFO33593.1 phage related lysozyme [Roseibium sp. TrichSKD4]
MQTVSERGLAEIAGHEGMVLSPYKDSVGVWTVGIGHTAGAGAPNPEEERRVFSVGEVMEIFARDIARFEARVRKAFTQPLTQEQFDAAVSFDFNTGGIHRATWVKLFNKGDLDGARKSFMAWRKPTEIIPRRKKERNLFFDGVYSGGGRVNTYPATLAGKVLWSKGTRVSLNTATRVAIPNPKPVSKSRTAAGSGVAGAGGAVLLVEPVRECIAVIEGQKAALSSDDITTLVVGGIVVAGALLALYARLDDGGYIDRWTGRG